jgi:hypothetical protein
MNADKTIQNCQLKVKIDCPKTWGNLEPTSSKDVRFCRSCSNKVYYCISDDEAIKHAELGNCIAIEIPSEEKFSRIFIGEVESTYPIKPEPSE